MPRKPRNRIGESYGQLTVIELSERRSTAGNAYWWCLCTCGRKREVPSDSLSHKKRSKKNITECRDCAQKLSREGVSRKNNREEQLRRQKAIKNRAELLGKVPENWLKLPLTDAEARELGQKKFFRGIRCLKGHLSPYRINGGCLKCAQKNKKN